jgi:hypothetical protein
MSAPFGRHQSIARHWQVLNEVIDQLLAPLALAEIWRTHVSLPQRRYELIRSRAGRAPVLRILPDATATSRPVYNRDLHALFETYLTAIPHAIYELGYSRLSSLNQLDFKVPDGVTQRISAPSTNGTHMYALNSRLSTIPTPEPMLPCPRSDSRFGSAVHQNR